MEVTSWGSSSARGSVLIINFGMNRASQPLLMTTYFLNLLPEIWRHQGLKEMMKPDIEKTFINVNRYFFSLFHFLNNDLIFFLRFLPTTIPV